MKRLVLIDGKSVFYRGYYAMGALSLPDGTPTGGVYGFAAIHQLNPTKVVVAWDSKTSTAKRRALYPEYKAGRVKPGDDFYTQIPLLEELIGDLGWSFVEIPDYEADDIIGSLALQADIASDYETFIPGIGEKTAAKLLNEYGDLDGIYQHLDDITGSTHAKLAAGKDSAYLSRKLAQIMFDAPIKLNTLPDFHFDKEKVISGLKKLEFNSLIRKIDAAPVKKAPEITASDYKMPDNIIIDYNVKSLMHKSDEVAQAILAGKKPFWDLSQAAFLLNPLKREEPQLSVSSEEYQKQRTEFAKYPKLYQIYRDFDLPLIPILYKMEKKGMLIDRPYFANLQQEYTAEVAKLEREVYDLAGQEFNVNSPIQLSEILFVDLKLPVKGIKKTTRGYSTGARELEKLKDLHPIIAKIIEYREAAKLLSTYITPMPSLADTDGRIHTTFTQNVTATGRLSSKDPNLQNIPVRTDEGKRIRTGFIAPKGCTLVSADYSQFELRLAAVLSNDQALIDDFNHDVDIHTKTASEAFNVPVEQVTKNQRRAAKVINFGVLYGMSVKGLAEAAHMPINEAKQFIDNYFALRAPIKRKLEAILKQAREQGYVETFYGRRRPTPDVKSSNFLIRQAAERAAQNMPIQGTEADLMKRAMINVDKALPTGAELVMQVHDSLIVECDEAIAPDVAKILKREMESVAPELPIKLAVDVTTGHNWGEL